MSNYELTPIGYMHCRDAKYKYDQPRQANLAERGGYIELQTQQNFEQALADLDGFSHIWVIFLFHLNENWKPKARPPRLPAGKSSVGTFACRSPYRPNPIGMSCVKLDKIVGRRLYISDFDLLDATPIVDIKPYIPQYDAFPEAEIGWLADIDSIEFEITWQPLAKKQADWILKHGKHNISVFVDSNLKHKPQSTERKRLQIDGDICTLAYRTWRIKFTIIAETVEIIEIFSGYSESELSPNATDKYGDKDLHRNFNSAF